MTQILSTLATFDGVVQGYWRDSRAVAPVCWIILNFLTATRPNALLRWERLLRVMPLLHLGLRWSHHRYRCLHQFLILSRRRLQLPWAYHPVHSFLCWPTPRLHLPSELVFGLRVAKGGGGGT